MSKGTERPYLIPGGGWRVCYLDVATNQAHSIPVIAWGGSHPDGSPNGDRIDGGELFEIQPYDATSLGEVGTAAFADGEAILWHPDSEGDDGSLNSHRAAANTLRRNNKLPEPGAF